MALWSERYHMLVSSLPPLPVRVDAAAKPMTVERLKNRMRMLEPRDSEEAQRMLRIFEWSRQFEEPNDEAVVRRYNELSQALTNPLVREVVNVALDIRMITAVLRRRRRKLGPPAIGIGRWVDHIRRHFNQADFRLSHVFPRIPEYEQMLDRGEILELHRALLESSWQYLKRRADDFHFSFEAVVLYVARWSLLRQWQDLQLERGRTIFEALVTEATGDHAKIYH